MADTERLVKIIRETAAKRGFSLSSHEIDNGFLVGRLALPANNEQPPRVVGSITVPPSFFEMEDVDVAGHIDSWIVEASRAAMKEPAANQ